MPAPDVAADTRAPQLLTVLFWGGVGLAPIAALILLVADGNGPLRLAAVLAIVAVVLIGLSIALRTDEGGRARVQELTEEVEQLRRELRGEIVAAAQRGNQALDQAQRAQDAVAGLHRRLAAGGAAVPAEEPAGPGRARVPGPGAPESTARQGGVSPAGQAGVYGATSSAPDRPAPDRVAPDRPAPDRLAPDRPAPDRPAPDRPVAGPAGAHGTDRHSRGGPGTGGPGAGRPTPVGPHDADRVAAGVYGAARPEPRTEPAPRPLGVVRHTETVHVTTRHTIVDGAVPGEQGGAYGGYGRWSAEPADRPWDGRGVESVDDPDLGRRGARAGVDGRAPAPGRSAGGSPRADRGWSAPGDDDRPGGAPGWSGPRAEGWVDPRDDDRPRGAARVEPGWAVPREESWSPREEQGRAGTGDDRAWSDPVEEGPWGTRDDRGDWTPRPDSRGDGPQDWEVSAARPGPAARPDDTGEYWAQLRAGDRWAAVREDDRGREVRVGERRAEVHADSAGTEYRVADRWAAVRHDEPRRAQEGPGPRRGADGPEPRWGGHGHEPWQSHDGGEVWRGGRGEPEDRPALPAGGVPVPQEWRVPQQRGQQPDLQRGHDPEARRGHQPEPERHGYAGQERHGYAEQERYRYAEQARHGYAEEPRYGYPPQDDGPRAGAAHWG